MIENSELEIIANSRELIFCYQKVAEELFECGEIVMKQITKPLGSEERIPHLVEELGDVILNIMILTQKLDLDEQVSKRIESKIKTLL